MPQVKRAGREVQPTGIGGGGMATGLPPSAFGAAGTQAGREIEHLSAKVYQEEREKADKLILSGERRALNEWEAVNIYDRETGAMSRRGQNSFGLPEELMGGLDAFVAERTQGLANDAQRQAYSALVDSRRETLNRWVHKYVGDEIRAVEGEEYVKGIESSKERGSADPDNVAVETERIRNTVMDRARVLGWSEEETFQELQGHESDLHKRTIKRLLAEKKGAEAKDYFEQVRGRLDEDVETELIDLVDTAALDAQAQQGASEVWRVLGPPDDVSPVNLDEMVELTRELYQDPATVKAITAQLKERTVLHNSSVESRVKELKGTFWDSYDKGTTTDELYASEEYLALNGVDRRELRNAIDTYQKREEAIAREVKREERAARLLEQQENWVVLASDPELLREADLEAMLRNHELNRSGYAALTKLKDPLKSAQAQAALKVLTSARTKRLFDPYDPAANDIRWAEYNQLLHDFIVSHPEEDPVVFVDSITKELELSFKGRVMDALLPGQLFRENAIERKRQRLRQQVYGEKAEEPTGNEADRQRAVDLLRVNNRAVNEDNIRKVLENMRNAKR